MGRHPVAVEALRFSVRKQFEKQLSPLASRLCHAMRMEKKPPEPDPNSKFAEVKKKAAELRAKKQMVRQEQNRRAEEIPRPSDEGEE
jgi:hypothetical protein